MISFINAEFYRLKKNKGLLLAVFFVFFLLIVTDLIDTTIIDGGNRWLFERVFILQTSNMFFLFTYIFSIFIFLNIIVIQDFYNSTIRHYFNSGISRLKYFSMKLLVFVIVCLILYWSVHLLYLFIYFIKISTITNPIPYLSSYFLEMSKSGREILIIQTILLVFALTLFSTSFVGRSIGKTIVALTVIFIVFFWIVPMLFSYANEKLSFFSINFFDLLSYVHKKPTNEFYSSFLFLAGFGGFLPLTISALFFKFKDI